VSRLPFDPDRARGAEAASGAGTAGGGDALTVSEASTLIRRALDGVDAPLRVLGQVSNLRAPGHWYFTLKDDDAVLGCVAWASSARSFGFRPEDGDEVIATGRIGYYPPQGRTQLYVSGLAPVGAGALHRRFLALCAELRELGYFADERKRPLPLMPRRVAVITSADGAAVRDVVSTAAHRCPAVGLLVVDVRVQGETAAAEVAAALRAVDRRRAALGVDAILVTRGGGSVEDLQAFNERVVADAAFRSRLPVVAAIGHESDTTVVELVADLRASTPTQAAMRLVPDAAELGRQVHHVRDRVGLAVERLLHRHRQGLALRSERAARRLAERMGAERVRLQRLSGVEAGIGRLRPDVRLAARRERLAALRQRLERAMTARADLRGHLGQLVGRLGRGTAARARRGRERLTGLEQRLRAVDPRGVLARGYSITFAADGAAVRSARDVAPGDRIRTQVADGGFDSTVDGEPRAPGRPRRAGGGRGRSQMDLFRGGE
jgi:exodeoxyribonuclease VII large subunit